MYNIRIYKYFDEINDVPIPYHWSDKLDDIDMEKEDLNQIIYEVVNHKAAKPIDKDKRAPKPRTRKKCEQSGIQQAWNIILIKLDYTRSKNRRISTKYDNIFVAIQTLKENIIIL